MPCTASGLTLPSSGPAFGRPLKSNVRALSMNSLRRGSSLPRRVFAHGLLLPFRLGSRHSRRLSSLPHASARVVPLARPQGCGQTTELACALRSVVRHIHAPITNSFMQAPHRRLRRYAYLPLGRSPRLPRRPNLKYEYEVQFSSCLRSQTSRSQRSSESSFSATGRIPHRRPNQPFKRTRLRLAA